MRYLVSKGFQDRPPAAASVVEANSPDEAIQEYKKKWPRSTTNCTRFWVQEENMVPYVRTTVVCWAPQV